MKYFKITLLLFILFSSLWSCQSETDLLDPQINTDLNQESVFSDSVRTVDFLYGIYTDIAHNWVWRRRQQVRGSFEDATETSVNRWSNQTMHYPINGSLSASIWAPPITDTWLIGYSKIRSVNLFLASIETTPITEATRRQLKAEARFLRAYYYEELIKHYAGVPILGDELISIDEKFDQPRNSYEECVNYIVSELDAIAPDLPLTHQPRDHGRITRGACLALKSKVLLYAASPLYNGAALQLFNDEGISVSPDQARAIGYENTGNVQDRWRAAAEAAEDVIRLGVYSLYEDNTTRPGYGFGQVFLMRVNPEYILQYNQAPNRSMESWFGPPSRSGGASSMPTQNLAECFGMNNGKPITDPASGYDPEHPFENRDPRFNFTFIYNGTPWYNAPTQSLEPIYTYDGAPNDGFDKIEYHTGYFWRKMMSENTSWQTGGSNTDRCLPIIRYAETLLNCAEASNEIDRIDRAYEMLSLIRRRAGIIPGADGLYGLKPAMTKEEMRKVIQNERFVELAYEEHRYWDVRRWNIAMETQNVRVMAMKITRLGADDYSYEVVPVNHANGQLQTTARTHFLPINQDELGRNPNLVQNPGY